jgi:hypothetical protein
LEAKFLTEKAIGSEIFDRKSDWKRNFKREKLKNGFLAGKINWDQNLSKGKASQGRSWTGNRIGAGCDTK